MKIRVLLFWSLFFVLCSYIKPAETPIDVDNLDQDKLELLIFEKVNELRKSKNITLLKSDDLLGLAAENHVQYLKKIKKLSHTQRNSKTKTPMDRATFYGGDFSYVGENIAFTFLYHNVKSVSGEKATFLTSYESTAEFFFQLWKNSKTHYRNMIDKDFLLLNIRFAYDSKNKRIYGVQVFGAL